MSDNATWVESTPSAPLVSKRVAVAKPVAMKSPVYTMLRTEKRELPQIPWPEAPLPMPVPAPTRPAAMIRSMETDGSAIWRGSQAASRRPVRTRMRRFGEDTAVSRTGRGVSSRVSHEPRQSTRERARGGEVQGDSE